MLENLKIDAELDLVLEREIPISPEQVWAAWTQEELLKQWFCPKPWNLAEVEIEAQPGGRFCSTMAGPGGESFYSEGLILAVVPNRLIAFTDALNADLRPAAEPFFTAVVTFEPSGRGTRYKAVARHKSAEDREKHESMGFHEGWSAALDQMIELMQSQS